MSWRWIAAGAIGIGLALWWHAELGLSDLSALERWCAQAGVVSFNVAMKHFGQQGVGLVATHDIPHGAEAVRVPYDAMIWSNWLRDGRTLAGTSLSQLGNAKSCGLLSAKHELAAVLALESLDPNSAFRVYLDGLLPSVRQVEKSVPFRSHDLDFEMDRDVHGLLQDMSDTYEKLSSCMNQAHPEIGAKLSMDLWRTCRVAVNSFSFSHENGSCVFVPFADKANHDPYAWSTYQFRDNDRYFQLFVGATTQGEQIFINYGNKSNQELLLGYGFIVPNNPHSCVLIALPQSISTDSVAAATIRKRLMAQVKGDHERDAQKVFCVKKQKDSHSSFERFWACLRILSANEDELSRVDGNQAPGVKSLGERSEAIARKSLDALVTTQLSTFAHSRGEDNISEEQRERLSIWEWLRSNSIDSTSL